MKRIHISLNIIRYGTEKDSAFGVHRVGEVTDDATLTGVSRAIIRKKPFPICAV